MLEYSGLKIIPSLQVAEVEEAVWCSDRKFRGCGVRLTIHFRCCDLDAILHVSEP